jgi:phosphatidylinositol glycan class N
MSKFKSIELQSEGDLILHTSSSASFAYMCTELKQATSLNFKPFIPLAGYEEIVKEIRVLIDKHQYDEAIKLSQELITLSLSGLHYFQTYDWFFLMGTVTMGYLGWMVYILLYVIKNYTSFLVNPLRSVAKSPVRQKKIIVTSIVYLLYILFYKSGIILKTSL